MTFFNSINQGQITTGGPLPTSPLPLSPGGPGQVNPKDTFHAGSLLLRRFLEFDKNKNGVLTKDELEALKAAVAKDGSVSQAIKNELNIIVENEREMSFITESIRGGNEPAPSQGLGISQSDIGILIEMAASGKNAVLIAIEARSKTAQKYKFKDDTPTFRAWVDQQRAKAGGNVSFGNAKAVETLMSRFNEFDANKNGVLNLAELTRAKQSMVGVDTVNEMNVILENNREFTVMHEADTGRDEMPASQGLWGISQGDLQRMKAAKDKNINIYAQAYNSRISMIAMKNLGLNADNAALFRQWFDQKRRGTPENKDDLTMIQQLNANFAKYDLDKNGVLDGEEMKNPPGQLPGIAGVYALNPSLMFATANTTNDQWLGLTKADLTAIQNNLGIDTARTLRIVADQYRIQAAQQYKVSSDPTAFNSWVESVRSKFQGDLRQQLIQQANAIGIMLHSQTASQVTIEGLKAAINGWNSLPKNVQALIKANGTKMILVAGEDVGVYPEVKQNSDYEPGLQGFYTHNSRNLVMNTKGMTQDFMQSLFIHEAGHAADTVRDTYVRSPQFQAARKTMNFGDPYYDNDPDEFFAEAFSRYFKDAGSRATLSKAMQDYFLKTFGPPVR